MMSKGAGETGRRGRRKPSQNVSYVEGNSDTSGDDDDDAPPPAKMAKTARKPSSTPASKTAGPSKSKNTSTKKSPQKSSTTTTKSTKPHDGTKNARGELVFDGVDDFRPNRTPKEVLHAGSFGGTYFRPIYSSVTKKNYGPEVYEELPGDWLKGLNKKTQVASPNYDVDVNKFKVKCGGSLEMWETSGWIVEQDPYGWFQWYCRFFQGRRSDDDERQIGRWKRCAGVKGRWRNNLVTKVFNSGKKKFDDPSVSPVVRQTLLHWGYELTEKDYDAQAKIVAKRK